MNDTERWLNNLRVPGRPDEFECKQLLSSRGIAVPPGMLLRAEETDYSLYGEPGLSFPLVAKVCDPEIQHKSDRGGVVLGLTAEDWREKLRALRRRFPGSNILLEEMVAQRGGEFIIGAVVDSVFGPAVMFGAGGILTELYRDVTFRLAPLSAVEARRMVKELVLGRLFDGYRGMEMDSDALAEIIAAVGNLVVALGPAFSQLDINPIVFDGKEWTALDALVMLR